MSDPRPYIVVDITRLDGIVEDARRKFDSTDANALFINIPSIGDYFDNISTAAGFLEEALKARSKVHPSLCFVGSFEEF